MCVLASSVVLVRSSGGFVTKFSEVWSLITHPILNLKDKGLHNPFTCLHQWFYQRYRSRQQVSGIIGARRSPVHDKAVVLLEDWVHYTPEYEILDKVKKFRLTNGIIGRTGLCNLALNVLERIQNRTGIQIGKWHAFLYVILQREILNALF